MQNLVNSVPFTEEILNGKLIFVFLLFLKSVPILKDDKKARKLYKNWHDLRTAPVLPRTFTAPEWTSLLVLFNRPKVIPRNLAQINKLSVIPFLNLFKLAGFF